VVDPLQTVAETREDNNQISRVISFAEHAIYLPSFRRQLP
jgi:subtilase family serine protease